MNWNLFVTELVAGTVHGCVYALIALGYSMVYGILKFLNFAHGDVFMIGAFIGYGVLVAFGGASAISIPIFALLALMFVCAMLGGGLLGVAIERFAYRRLRDAPRIAPLITALGVSFFLENVVLLVIGGNYDYYDTYGWIPGTLWSVAITLPSGVRVALAQLIVIGGAIVLVVALTLFVNRTQLGRAMRAVAYDRQAAEMMGIDINRVISTTFFIGSALAGAAGIFNCLVYQQVWYYMGFQQGLYAFTAAVIGGIGSLPGAVLGGLVLGIAQSLTIGYVSSTFSDAMVFVILIAFMILRPSGILGKAAAAKV
jgi:branched-chain amino acid transport system permease protein